MRAGAGAAGKNKRGEPYLAFKVLLGDLFAIAFKERELSNGAKIFKFPGGIRGIKASNCRDD